MDNQYTRRKDMEKALRNEGCRMTHQRKVILKYLASTDSHPSAREILEQTQKIYPCISLATVYNTLEILARLNLIKIMDFQARDNRHETNTSPHINLICMTCGRIEDFDEGLSVPVDRVKKDLGFEVKDFRMEYYGHCAQCKSENAK